MEFLQQSFTVSYQYKVFFTEHLFHPSNTAFAQFLQTQHTEGLQKKILFVVDTAVAEHHPQLQQQIIQYFKNTPAVLLTGILTVIGGEEVKNSETYVHQVLSAINQYGIDRHSYVAAIGGGSVLDMVGYASAIAHRGVKHIRIPTTVLSQNDSGIGVKNSINYFGKKNFLGTFAPPVAVFNDAHFLTTLSERDWSSGISEAVKVALIKDAAFFSWLEQHAADMATRDMQTMQYQIKRSAELHLQHIASGDPFEMGSARPLDFGHWSAHKLEQLSNFAVRHGEAVAMGIALDSTYSYLSGRIAEEDLLRILHLLENLGLAITHPLMEIGDKSHPLLAGLNEFREHLGGKLTITLLKAIGKGEEVHEMNIDLICKASQYLQQYCLTEQKHSI
ncbi:3-dehydroquinate synthase [Ilyomonas limi]|uniref:3-dehydroquinate synthase n=1 Tax=Ilyomonas limi TaxID=2575867 RepID=A0A4U3L4E2_9BACT|nr:3-dehydroquinate synthase [Ilyomonas limi]TKK68486.1 3-dehydroquinate synthase [Ilyomonas limi]